MKNFPKPVLVEETATMLAMYAPSSKVYLFTTPKGIEGGGPIISDTDYDRGKKKYEEAYALAVELKAIMKIINN